MKKIILLFIFFCLGGPTILAQRAGAYQVGSYLAGVVNVRDYANLPPGVYFADYNFWISTSGYYDQNGNKVKQMNLDLSVIDPDLSSVTLDLDVSANAYVNVPVIAYASKFKILGARYIAAIAPVLIWGDYRISVDVPEIGAGGSLNPDVNGVGDLVIIPLFLSWNFEKNFDIGFAYTVYTPTGRYENGASDNIGLGHWTHQFQTPFYAYFLEQATAIAVIPTIEFNGKIKDVDVRTGTRFSLEYGISQYFTEWLEVQIMNSHNWQIGDDTGEDVWWNNTPLETKDSKNTFMAGVGLWPWKEKLYVSLRYSFDYGIHQRFKANYFSVSIGFVPNLLAN